MSKIEIRVTFNYIRMVKITGIWNGGGENHRFQQKIATLRTLAEQNYWNKVHIR